MSNYKEIVTKTIIGKGRKTFNQELVVTPENIPDTVLGCWVINHKFNGQSNKNEVTVTGTFDVNVWYSYDKDSKTAVTTKNFSYTETMNLRIKDYDSLSNENEIIVRSLKQPTVQDVKITNNEVHLNVEKELGVEIVGEGKVKIAIEEDELPWDEIYDENNDVEEDYIKDSE